MFKDEAPQSEEPRERRKVRRKKQKRRPVPDLGPFPDLSWGAPPDPGQPPWVPSMAEAERVPETVRQALMDFILPIYQRSVVQANNSIEQSLNVTAVHLLWLEVLEQFSHKQEYMNVAMFVGSDSSREDQIARLLRVLETKVRVGHLLVRLQELRAQAAARRGDVLDAPAEPLPVAGTAVAPPANPENFPNTEELTVVDQKAVSHQEPAVRQRRPSAAVAPIFQSPIPNPQSLTFAANTEKSQAVAQSSGPLSGGDYPWPPAPSRSPLPVNTEKSRPVDQIPGEGREGGGEEERGKNS